MKTITAALVLVSSAMAGTVTLTMNEVPNQPINGLTVSKGGENFTFQNPSGTLFYNSSGPGIETFVQDPSIQGSTAPFGVVFSIPVTFIQFGLAALSSSPISPMAMVLLNFSGGGFANLSFNSSLIDPFTEGQFTYSGAPVANMLITPPPPAIASFLAFDNLTVTTVPEPSTFSMLMGAAALAAVRILRLRRR
jgi:hypothetical protein